MGGPGKEFFAAGKNWSIDAGGLNPENLAMIGQWRVEVTPTQPRKDDLFLHVIQVGGQAARTMDKTELIEAQGLCGARITSGRRAWEVTFSTSGELAGHLECTGAGRAIDTAFANAVQPQAGIMARADKPTGD